MTDCATKDDQCHPRKIFVGGLGHKLSTQGLREHFSRFGPIVDAVVLRWPDGRSRGFGYVTFADIASAAAAIEEPHEICGREVDVKRAVPGTNKLFVGGLPQSVSAAEMRTHFEGFGIVSDAVVMIDPATNRSRGFGFVCFLPGPEGAAAVEVALSQYEHHHIRGKWIEVKSAAPPHKLMGKDGMAPACGSACISEGACDAPEAAAWAAPEASERPLPREATLATSGSARIPLSTSAPGQLSTAAPGQQALSAWPSVPTGHIPLPPQERPYVAETTSCWGTHAPRWSSHGMPLQSPPLEEASRAWMRHMQPQSGGFGPLPSLLTSGDSSPTRKNPASPMKVRVRAPPAWAEVDGIAPDASPASKELQRSLEDLRLQSEPSHVRVEDTATTFNDASVTTDDSYSFFMEDRMVEAKLER